MSKHVCRFRFGLLGLFGIVAIAALACGLAARTLDLHTKQLEIAARIAGVDRTRLTNVPCRGSTAFMRDGHLTKFLVEPSQGWASEAARMLGRSYRVDVVGIELAGANHDYENLKLVMLLPRLRRLIFREARITRQLIASLAEITWLEELTFLDTTLTEQQVNELRERLPNTAIVVD